MVRCDALEGKVIQTFSLYEDGPYGPEILIEFTDGTSFNSCLRSAVTLEAKLLQSSGGQSQVLKDFSTPASLNR